MKRIGPIELPESIDLTDAIAELPGEPDEVDGSGMQTTEQAAGDAAMAIHASAADSTSS